MAATRAKKEAHEKPAPARRGKSQAAAAQLLTKLVAQVDGLSAEMRTLKMDLESMHAQLQAVQSGAPVAPRVALSDAAAEPLPVSDLQAELAEAIESGELDEMADEPLPVAEYTTEPEDVYPKVEAEGLEDPEKGPRLPPSENDRMMMSEDDIKSLLAEATDATPEAAGAAVGPVDALFEGLELVEAEGLGDAAPVAAESGSAPVLAAAWSGPVAFDEQAGAGLEPTLLASCLAVPVAVRDGATVFAVPAPVDASAVTRLTEACGDDTVVETASLTEIVVCLESRFVPGSGEKPGWQRVVDRVLRRAA
jgi:hypothetical protein